MHHIKDFLEKLNSDYEDITYYNPLKLISKVISYNYEPIVKKARDIAKNLIKINNIEKMMGMNLKNQWLKYMIILQLKLVLVIWLMNIKIIYLILMN